MSKIQVVNAIQSASASSFPSLINVSAWVDRWQCNPKKDDDTPCGPDDTGPVCAPNRDCNPVDCNPDNCNPVSGCKPTKCGPS